jgi:hypothetical protein
MPCCGFSRSSLWQLAYTDVRYGPLFHWHDSSVTTRAHVAFLKKLLGVKKGTDTHCVLRETGQMPIFFYWFRCTIRFWNSLFTLFKQPSSWGICAGWFTSCKQKCYMDLPGSACTPRLTYISTAFGCHMISLDYQSRTVWTHSTWTYHWGLERSWHVDTTWSSPFQQNYEDISHTFWCTLGEYS